MNHRITSLTRSDGQNQLRFKTWATRADEARDAERQLGRRREIDASSGIPARHYRSDSPEIPPGRDTARVTSRLAKRTRCTADPTTHAFLMLNAKSERSQFAKTLRRSQRVGGGNTRPMQFTEDLTWDIETSQNKLDTRSFTSTARWTSSSRRSSSTEVAESETRHSGENGRRHPEVPEREVPTNQRQKPKSQWVHGRGQEK